MEYRIYRLAFQGAVHFGNGSLEGSAYTFCADTLFSALCQEAAKMGEDVLLRLSGYAKDGVLLLSDAFPCADGVYFLPKPIRHIEAGENRGDSLVKKAYKKLSYLPMDEMGTYLSGKFDVLNAADVNGLGFFEMKVSASVRGEEETAPYRIGTFCFREGSGLYFIAGHRTLEAAKLLEELLDNLSFSGIGGKRAAGLGRFRCVCAPVPDDFLKRLRCNDAFYAEEESVSIADRSRCGRGGQAETETAGGERAYMTLSVSLPREEELADALRGAEYLLCRRSGFVASEQFADRQMRKQDLYVLKAGSCVRVRYRGDIYDVSGGKGAHPVYRYAKPMFMEVGI